MLSIFISDIYRNNSGANHLYIPSSNRPFQPKIKRITKTVKGGEDCEYTSCWLWHTFKPDQLWTVVFTRVGVWVSTTAQFKMKSLWFGLKKYWKIKVLSEQQKGQVSESRRPKGRELHDLSTELWTLQTQHPCSRLSPRQIEPSSYTEDKHVSKPTMTSTSVLVHETRYPRA